jgi:hypothetical protein
LRNRYVLICSTGYLRNARLCRNKKFVIIGSDGGIMRRRQLLTGLLLAVALTASTSAANRYVATNGKDTNAGTISKPLKTIQRAINNSATGDTIYVTGGNYKENLTCQNKTVTIIRSGTALVNITAQSSTLPTITLVNSNSRLELLSIGGGKYTIDGANSSFAVVACSVYGGSQACVHVNSGSPLIHGSNVYGGTKEGLRVDAGSPWVYGSGVYGCGTTAIDVVAGTVKVQCSVVRSSPTGILLASGAAGSIISNSDIVKCSLDGIRAIYTAGKPSIYNCILWGNGDDLDGCTATWSCIKDDDPGTGNISSYPYFADWNANGYHLTWNSPCVNRGSPVGAYANQQDLYGGPRLVDTVIDMGADEFDYTGPNLVANGGFENGSSSGVPSSWSISHQGTGGQIVDTATRHSGARSWCLSNDGTKWCGAMSELIAVEPSRKYRLSVCTRTNKPGAIVRLGWMQYASNGQTVLENADLVVDNSTSVAGWTRLSAVRATMSNAAYVRVIFYGPDRGGSGGQIWWDDVDLRVAEDDAGCYGIENVLNKAVTFDFGGNATGLKSTNYLCRIDGNAALPRILSDRLSDPCNADLGYRSINAGGELTIPFPAFNTDTSGFPLTPMMLEIMYKDVYLADSQDYVTNCPLVTSKLQYDGLDKDYLLSDNTLQYQLAHLGGAGDGKWKHLQVAFAQNDYQLLRAIGGNYEIRIRCKGTAQPINYVSLRTITQAQYDAFTKSQRDAKGFIEVEPADSPASISSYSGLAVFVRDVMNPVYRQTIPAESEVISGTSQISLRSAWGLTEPVTLGIYSPADVSGVTFSVSDLHRQNGTPAEKVDASRISVFRTIYDYSRLEPGPWTCNYASVPVRLEPLAGGLSVAAGTSQGIWLEVQLPPKSSGLPAGLYTGTITIRQGGSDKGVIALEIDVTAAELAHSEHTNPMYWDPYCTIYSSSLEKALDIFRQAEAEPFLWNLNTDYNNKGYEFGITVARDNSGHPLLGPDGLPAFDATNFAAMLDRMKAKGITAAQMHVLVYATRAKEVYQALTGSVLSLTDRNLYYKLKEPGFIAAYKKLIAEYQAVGSDRNIEFIFHVVDEPGVDPQRRIVCDRLLTYIHECGALTGCTYYASCDESISGRALGTYNVPGNTLLPLTGLVDRKLWNWGGLDTGYARHQQQSYPGTFGYYTTEIAQMADPVYNRFHHGLFAFATDAKDVAAYAMAQYFGDPCNPFDAGAYSSSYNIHDYALAYPTWRGDLLPAIGGIEAIREGIKDARCIATLKALIASHQGDPAATAAQAYLDSLKARISKTYVTSYLNQADDAGYAAAILKAVSATGDPTDYGAFTTVRNTLLDYISQLSNQ